VFYNLSLPLSPPFFASSEEEERDHQFTVLDFLSFPLLPLFPSFFSSPRQHQVGKLFGLCSPPSFLFLSFPRLPSLSSLLFLFRYRGRRKIRRDPRLLLFLSLFMDKPSPLPSLLFPFSPFSIRGDHRSQDVIKSYCEADAIHARKLPQFPSFSPSSLLYFFLSQKVRLNGCGTGGREPSPFSSFLQFPPLFSPPLHRTFSMY